MKATVALSALLPALERSERATSSSSSISVLRAFHFEVTKHLFITGTNMESVIRTDVSPVMGRKAGVLVAGPARQIVQALKTLPNDAVVTLEGKGKLLVVTSGRSSLKFETHQVDAFPKLPPRGSHVATVEASILIDAFNHVSTCYSTDASRPVLCGVRLELEGDALRMAATDSWRLGAIETKAVVREAFEGIIPGVALSEAARIAKTSKSVEIYQSEKHVWFMSKGTSLATRKIDGTFPTWRQFRDDEFQPGGKPPLKVSLNLAQALESCSRIVKLGRQGQPLRLTIAPGADHVTLALVSHDGMAVEETVEATIEGKTRFEVGLNPGFFAKTLATAQGDAVHLRLTGEQKSVFVSGNDVENPDRWTIVMPIRLAS